MTASRAKARGIEINDVQVAPGTRASTEIRVARLPTDTWLSIPVSITHGRLPGSRLWLSAAIHGDEINGVEIIRHVQQAIDPRRLRGTVIAVPIVNVFGFLNRSRYLPDRRDLNRSFPGSQSGSLAARLARLFMTEIVEKCTHGIDFHTGSDHRTNQPQIRADLTDAATRTCAEAFAAPIMMNAEVRPGSLRESAARTGRTVLLYEGGETLRFDEPSIKVGVEGVLRVMRHLQMYPFRLKRKPPSYEVHSTRWVRARRSGIAGVSVSLGQAVAGGEPLATIRNALGDEAVTVSSPFDGIVIGLTNNPLVNRGDALVHVARTNAVGRP